MNPCPPGALCHSRIETITQQLRDTAVQRDLGSSQGKYDEVEEVHGQVLALYETVLGKEHPSTLGSMNDHASVLSSQGKYEEAEEMHGQALALRERVLGKEHPDTLTSVYCLAYLLHHKKRYKDADVFYHRAYSGYRKTLGEKHPTTAACSQADNYHDEYLLSVLRRPKRAVLVAARILGSTHDQL